MTLELRVDKPAAKIGASLAVVILSALLAFVVVRNFFIGALSDE